MTADDVLQVTPDEAAELKSIAENGDGAALEGASANKSGNLTSPAELDATTDTQATGAAVAKQSNSPPATQADAAAFQAAVPELTGSRAGNINLDCIQSADDAKAALQAVARMSDDFPDARRGVQSHQDTDRLAADLGMTTERLLKRRHGQAFNAEEATAARDLMTASAEDLVTKAKAAQAGAEGNPAPKAAGAAGLCHTVAHREVRQPAGHVQADCGRLAAVACSLSMKAGPVMGPAFLACAGKFGATPQMAAVETAAAIAYTLIETAKRNCADPQA